jgi:outer membrane protein assembly factor BamB
LKGIDGTLLWSYTTAGAIRSSPAIGDINNDGIPEVIVGASTRIYALKGTNGTLLWSFNSNSSVFGFTSPAIADVNNDGLPEVIALTDFGNLYILRGSNGTISWYKIFYPDTTIYFYPSPVIADVNNDGIQDIVVVDWSTRVRVLRGTDGNLVWSKQLEINNSNYWSLLTPAIGDINNDGIKEITVDARLKIYALRGDNGNTIWSVSFISGVDSPRVDWPGSIQLADIDPSPGLEILVNFRFHSSNTGETDSTRLFSSSGNLLWSMAALSFPVNSAIGDVDGDGCSEIVVTGVPSTRAVAVIDAPGSNCGSLTPVEINETKLKYEIISDGIKFDKDVYYELYKVDGRLINKNYGNFVKVKNKGIYFIKVGDETIKFISK